MPSSSSDKTALRRMKEFVEETAANTALQLRRGTVIMIVGRLIKKTFVYGAHKLVCYDHF